MSGCDSEMTSAAGGVFQLAECVSFSAGDERPETELQNKKINLGNC